MQKRNWRQIFILSLFFVVAPLISWYYLRKGLGYRVEAIQELAHIGKVAPGTLVSLFGDTLRTTDMQGRLSVAQLLDMSDPAAVKEVGNHLQELHNQFDARQDVLFLIHLQGFVDVAQVSAFAREYDLDDPNQVFFFSATGAQRMYFIPKPDPGTATAALVDTATEVRKFYNTRDGAQLTRLTEHLALLLPMESGRKELEFRRDKEK